MDGWIISANILLVLSPSLTILSVTRMLRDKILSRNITFWQKRGHILWEQNEFYTSIRLRTLPETFFSLEHANTLSTKRLVPETCRLVCVDLKETLRCCVGGQVKPLVDYHHIYQLKIKKKILKKKCRH